MTGPAVSIQSFLPFYEYLMPRRTVESALRELVAAVAVPERVEGVLDEVWEDLVTTVEGHSFRALIGEFHTFRESRCLPRTDSGDEALRLFCRHLGDAAECRRVLGTYPVLEERLETVLRNTLDAYAELFAAYADDRTVLREAGLVPSPTAAGGGDDRVEELFITGSDPHNDNRQVFGLRLAGGVRVVYKPRALVSDRFVRDLYTAADPFLKYSLQGCAPLSVTVGSHGWQQFVASRPMDAPDQPARYFYRFGALCAILGAVGASDLHDENLLACGEHPCVIDTETVVRPDAGVDNDSLPHLLVNHMKLSVVSTMLVPMVNPTSPIDVMMAGVGVSGEQSSKMTRPVVRDKETDAISVGREPVTYRHKGNVPRLGKDSPAPTEYFADIQAGYSDALAFVRSDDITKVVDSHPDMPVRCLLRSTMVYSRFIDASTHPDYLARPEEATRLFGLLKHFPDYLSPEAADYVREAERASLASGNVPYFISRGDSTELATLTTRLPGVYRTTPLETARRGVALNAERTDRYHHFLLEECFSEVVGEDDPAGLHAHSVFGGTALDLARSDGWWRGIARTIADIGVTFEGPEGPETGWLGGIGPGRNAATITAGNFVSFHDYGGIVAFLDRASRYDSELLAVRQGAARGLDTLLSQYGDVLMLTPEGVFSGAASLLLTRPDEPEPGWTERVFDKIGERSAAGDLDTDLVNGPAGLLMLLLSRAEAGEPVPGGERWLARLRDLTLSHAQAPRTAPWFDVAHGELGLHWASARMGRVLGDPRPTRESADWLTERSASGMPVSADGTPLTGWCNGAAGLLLSSAEIMASAGREEWLSGGRLAALVDAATRLPAGQPVDLSVCHGSSGVIQSLLAAGRILGDPSLAARAHEYQDLVLRTIRANGFFTGSPGRTSLLGYMLGWAGVGDTDLLLHSAGDGPGSDSAGLSIPVALTSGVLQ